MIRLEHVRKAYPNVTPLSDVNAEIKAGDVISVIGPSGTGKSTLLRCINMLERPDGGKIYFGDEEITSPKCNIYKIRQKMGMVFQRFNLFGNLTVIENIMLAPVRLKGESRQSAYENGMRLLRQVGLPEKYLNYPDELSGGQKQRIAIARALAMNPDVILLDEPTSALDPTMVGEVQAVIRELARSGKTMMIVTHEMNFARAICSRVFYLDEGEIYEEGTPAEIFTSPKREKTRRFIRHLHVTEFRVKDGMFDFPGAVSAIDTFCQKNMIGGKQAMKLQLVFEELMQGILIPVPGVRNIHAAIEHSEESGEILLEVRYDGALMSPAEGDAVSYSLVKAEASDIQHTAEEADGFTNRVRILIQ
ncbi:MAG: amino acid ABC transporter ATP-binding protein [Synergistaceae bacterium]|nr:amino acid ABC transporter ATP-binding protein [Synergistaceae bacterium]